MANRTYIDGKDVVLFIKRINATVPETTFNTIACLDSNDFSGSVEKKVVNNKCTGGWEDGIAGNGTWSITGSGQAITDTEAAEVNYQILADIWIKKEVVEIKMANADGSYYRAGEALVTDFSETASTDEPLSFTITFNGLGLPVILLD
jgi:TP901-1 family phage major tail protein